MLQELSVLVIFSGVVFGVGKGLHQATGSNNEWNREHGRFLPHWCTSFYLLFGVGASLYQMRYAPGVAGFGLLIGLVFGWIHGLLTMRMPSQDQETDQEADQEQDLGPGDYGDLGNPYESPRS
ncbi:MAG: hypothetical protein AAF483_25910 [Planctomycetota bacterium]